MNKKKLRTLKVEPFIRGYLGSQGEALPKDLIGAKIIYIGCAYQLENGFVIDYIPVGAEKTQRLVICSTELGMWIEGKCTL
jgi:hypothetical protein